MRLFIALEISEALRSELYALEKEVRARSSGGKFVPPENFHITLHFIGETEDPSPAEEALREACLSAAPFTLGPFTYGYFEKGARVGRTALAAPQGDTSALFSLREALEDALEKRGLPRDKRPYLPHVTLGRSVGQDELTASELASIPLKAEYTATGAALFKSERVNGRQVYTPIFKESFSCHDKEKAEPVRIIKEGPADGRKGEGIR